MREDNVISVLRYQYRMVFGRADLRKEENLMMLDIDGFSESEKERLCLERIEKMLEQILAEARSRSALALAQLYETFPPGAKRAIVRGVGYDPNGGTGVTKLEEECVNLAEIERLMQDFLDDVQSRLALIRGESEEAPN